MTSPTKPRGRPSVPEEEVKKQIIGSAIALLFDKGYDATTIEAVASHAGVAKKTVYRFAKNREELLGLSVRNWTDNYAPLLQSDPTDKNDVLPALRKLLAAICGQALSVTAVKMFRLLNTEFPGKDDLLKKYTENGIARGQQLLTEWITRQQKQGWLPMLPADTSAKVILAMCVAEPLRQAAIGLIDPVEKTDIEAHLDSCMPFILLIFRQGDE
ncbi:TetR/AcrR family transcriptional regulator [Enterobacter ludwigii]|uniref:TetR/AcrR family transcriptional regulator n=1 Tax=Enterobacter ludwigii TaxID=299767 RepID=UPI0018C269F6|nr:TetR/AcrR family transcriptional regulator [Enterobacter ludwigii]MBG0635027.1 TetR/AcrR family transcriptional regulator [Enterobacter ludwigii]